MGTVYFLKLTASLLIVIFAKKRCGLEQNNLNDFQVHRLSINGLLYAPLNISKYLL